MPKKKPTPEPTQFAHEASNVLELPLEQVEPNPWNPNTQDDATFNRLAQELGETGQIDPIQVVALDTGKYRILGGEHRYHAAKVLGWETISAVVLTDAKWDDEDLQKFVTLRLNVLKGKINPEKMRDLYQELVERYDHEALADLMAFTDTDAFSKLVGEVKDALKDSGLPPDMVDQFEKAAKEMQTVDDLSLILNRLFTEYGETLPLNFMVFSQFGKKMAFVGCEDPEFKAIEKGMKTVRGKRIRADRMFAHLMTTVDLNELPPECYVKDGEEDPTVLPEDLAGEAPKAS